MLVEFFRKCCISKTKEAEIAEVLVQKINQLTSVFVQQSVGSSVLMMKLGQIVSMRGKNYQWIGKVLYVYLKTFTSHKYIARSRSSWFDYMS